MLEMEEDYVKDFSFKHDGEEFNVKLPDYLIPVVSVQHKTHWFYPNVDRYDMCKICAVNFTKLKIFKNYSWVLVNICNKCKGDIPCLLFHVSTIAGFPHCQQKFWFTHYQGLKEPSIQAALEGTIAHSLDEFLVKYLANLTNINKIKDECKLSKEKISEYLINLLNKEYDKLAVDIVRRQREDFGDRIEVEDILKLKEELFEDFIKDYAYLYAARIWQNLKSGGVYHKLLATRWIETRVMAYDIFFGIKILQIGRIDAMYQLSDDSYFIRDGKSSKRITVDSIKDGGFWTTRFQFGGYSHALQQMYGKKINIMAMVYLLRYHDLIPDFCDVEGYLINLQEIAELILYKKTPTKAVKGGLCSRDWCIFYQWCKEA